jgi:membrane protein implicated in regulation of membrane protease activity
MIKTGGSLALSVFLAAGFFFWIATKQAHAYIDIGSASFILQIAVASFFGSLFTLKVFWRRVVDKVSRVIAMVKGSKETPSGEDSAELR